MIYCIDLPYLLFVLFRLLFFVTSTLPLFSYFSSTLCVSLLCVPTSYVTHVLGFHVYSVSLRQQCLSTSTVYFLYSILCFCVYSVFLLLCAIFTLLLILQYSIEIVYCLYQLHRSTSILFLYISSLQCHCQPFLSTST